MQKSKGFLKKSCAIVVAISTFLTTVSSSGLNSVFADESTEVADSEVIELNTETSQKQDNVSQDTTEVTKVAVKESSEKKSEESQSDNKTSVKKEDTQGSIYVKLNEGGTVVVTSGSKVQTIEKVEGKVTVKDSNSTSVDVTNSLVNGYYLVTTKDIGSTVTVESTAKQGYSVETYKILTDSGEVAEETKGFSAFSDKYKQDVTVSKTSKYVTVSFKEDEVELQKLDNKASEENEAQEAKVNEDTALKTTPSDYPTIEELAKMDNWEEYARKCSNWLCRQDEFLTPQGMIQAYKDLGLGEFVPDYSRVSETYSVNKYMSANTRAYSSKSSHSVTYYALNEFKDSGNVTHKVGSYEVDKKLAFCIDHKDTSVAKGTKLDYDGEAKNSNLRKVLYYGYKGPKSVVGDSKADRGLTTLCASIALGTYNKHNTYNEYVANFYHKLLYDKNGDARPNPPSSFIVHVWSTGDSDYQRLATWEYNPNGYLAIIKSPEEGCEKIVKGNDMYSLKGAKFEVYSDSALTKSVGTLTTDEDGRTKELSVEAGTYYVKETKAPKGYIKATKTKKVVVESELVAVVDFENEIQGDPAGIRLCKQPASDMTTATGNTSLEGAEYTVKYYDNMSWSGTSKKTWVFKTDILGRINFDENHLVSGKFYYKDGHPIFLNGTYSVQETKAPAGYKLDPNIYEATVEGNDSWKWTKQTQLLLKTYNEATGETAFNEETCKGSVKIYKVDAETGTKPQGNAFFKGITFTILNKSENPVSYNGNTIPVGGVVTTITTDSSGEAALPEGSLECGTYEIYESGTNASMTLSDKNHYKFTISSDGQIVSLASPFKNKVVRGDVKILKQDKELHDLSDDFKGRTPQGDASLEGVVFEIYNRSNNPVVVGGKTYEVGAKITTITTKYEGDDAVAKTTGGTFPYGKYGIKEVSTDGSYLLTDGKEYTFYIIKNGETVTSDTSGKELIWENEVKRGGVSVKKWDNDFGSAYAQGDASLSGATYAIKNISPNPVVVDGVVYSGKDATDGSNVVKTITTNSSGFATTEAKCLPVGTYEIYEVSASTGYLVNSNWKGTFKISKDKDEGQMVDFNVPVSTDSKALCYESVIRGGVQVIKNDIEIDKSEVLGGASLVGIDFEITNESAHNVYVEGREYRPGEVVKTITTHWNESKKAYTAETSSSCLPYGTYSIKEVKTNNSYLLSDGNKRTFRIRSNGTIVTKDTSGVNLIWRNQVVRGDVEFVKIADTTSRRISAPFIITNKATHEQHVVVTDVNGQYNSNSSWNKHSTKTNANDWIIETLKSDPSHCFKVSELDSTAGVWFGLGEFGTMANVQDNLGALPYGEYILSEVRCESNASYDLQNFNFTVYKDGVTVHLGTITNDESFKPTISTVALDSETGRHVSRADKDVTIIDTVRVTGLVIGDEYTIKGRVMDYEDENVPISVNVDGKVRHLKSEVTFTANNVTMDVEVPFKFDGSTLENKTGVCYEGLYRQGKLLVEEVDIDNADQAFHFPTISTEARDFSTGDNVGNSLNSKVVDKVSFTNLVPDDDYVMKGKLYNKEDGTLIAEGSTTFIPDTSDGTVDVTFEFSKDVKGMDLVATEELLVNNVVVAEHKDLEDEAQTVHYPDLSTSAKDVDTDSQVGKVDEEATIEDAVECKNLVVGKEYTIKGKLINKDTGEDLGITAETTFTAEEKNETRILTFKYNTSELAGKTVVVFEDLFHNDVNIATHSDLNDSAQSVYYPEITTKALDKNTKDKICAKGTTDIIDTVHCTNLVVGEEYSLSGVLMDKDTNSYLSDAQGSPVKASAVFTATDTTQDVSVIFSVNTDSYEGKTIVAYENLMKGDVVVRTHTDLEDKDQTVNVIKVRTKAKSQTELKEMYAGEEQTIIDTVMLDNLVVNKEYTVKGNLRLKSTGDPIVINGSLVTAETKFTATETHMEVDLVFNIDARALKGETVVAYEDVYFNDVLVGSHADIEDKEQSIRVPKVMTKAFDDKTLIDESLVEDKVNITDTVKYYNLEAGATYTVKGTIMDKETGLPLKEDDKYIVGSTTFIAGTSEVLDAKLEFVDDIEEAFKSEDTSTTDLGKEINNKSVDGSVNVAFSIKASELGGKTIVMYENLYRDGILVASHNDISDKDQDIKFIKIGTEAKDNVTKSHELNYSETSTIIDTVSYNNVTVGTTYKLVATLKDKETGETIVIDGKEVIAEKTFTAETVSGYVDVEIPFDATSLQGKSVVVFESMYNDGKLVALHIDLDDEKQTVHIPKVSTGAIDKDTELQETAAISDRNIVDTLSYENLTAGKTYTVKGILMDKSTNQPIQVNGKDVVAEKEFVAGAEETTEEPEENEDVTNTEDSTENSEVKETTEESEESATEDSEVGDTGATEDSEEGATEGSTENSESEEEDTQDEAKEARVSGTVSVDFNFDATELAGKTIVVYEEIYSESGLVAHHTDIDDERQTITIPKIGTTATDSVTKTHEQQATEKAKIIDRVAYSNLIVGKEYEVTGVLMDKATGNPILIKDALITSSVIFKPTKSDGYVDVVFEFDSSLLAGTDIVVYETVLREGREVAIHKDIKDKDQTVSVTDIKTTATDAKTGKHKMTLGDNVKLTDKVEYTNLAVGKKYTLKGTVVDKSTGKAITTGEKSFKVKKSDGTVDVTFTLDTEKLQDKTLVVFEELYDEDNVLVAVHKDIEDKGQTVTVPVKPKVPKTWDMYSWLYPLGAGLLILGIGIVILILIKRKRNK